MSHNASFDLLESAGLLMAGVVVGAGVLARVGAGILVAEVVAGEVVVLVEVVVGMLVVVATEVAVPRRVVNAVVAVVEIGRASCRERV